MTQNEFTSAIYLSLTAGPLAAEAGPGTPRTNGAFLPSLNMHGPFSRT
jgi:hypothetical protein